MKKLISVVLLLTMTIVLLAGCGTSTSSDSSTQSSTGTGETKTEAPETKSPDDEKVYRLKLGTVLTDKDPIVQGMNKMAEECKEKTKGRLIIDVYPSSQLGDTPDVLEQAIAGSNVGILIDTGILADYVPDMAIYSAPYVFTSVENARKFIETDIFKSWDKELTKYNIHDLGCNWYQGARSFATKKKVEVPGDLNGLRIRTMGTTVAQESMKAMGCTPTSLSWSEVYSGMQSNVIDGYEAQTTAIYGASLQEVTTNIALTEHFLLYTAIVIAEDWFQSLPAEFQTILSEASISAGDYATKLVIDLEESQKAEIRAGGVEYVEVDKTPFIKASQIVYEKMGWNELKAEIDKVLGQ